MKLLIACIAVGSAILWGNFPLMYRVVAKEEVVLPKKEKTKEEIIMEAKHAEEILRVRFLESTNGKNSNPHALHNICKAQGKTNEFGYGGMKMKICFDTFEESVQKIDEWFEQREKEAFCYYNQGIRTPDCNYAKEAKSL